MRSTKSPSWTERLLGLDPLPAPSHVFALTPEELLYARLPRREDGERWQALARRVSLRPGALSAGTLGGELHDPSALAEALGTILEGVDGRVDQASLVVPDDWIRTTSFTVGELPSGRQARTEVERWKLKRVVPLPVEGLRIAEVEVRAAADGEGQRVTVAFSREALLAGIEDVFEERGIHLGRILHRSAALVPAIVDESREVGRWALASVTPGGYTLTFVPDGGPAVFRSKSWEPTAEPERVRPSVLQDLRLTRAFLREQLGHETFDEVYLVASDSERSRWSSWLEQGLGVAPRLVVNRSLPASELTLPVEDAAPLVGAASMVIR